MRSKLMLAGKSILAALPSNSVFAVTLTAFLLSACATSVTREDWPSSMPDRRIFVQAWERQSAAGTVSNDLENHLVWIVRFYEGSVLYPIGWNDMTESVVESLDGAKTKKRMRQRLLELGIAICIEWAQDNGKRKIDSNAVAVWGNALRTAVEEGEQIAFVGIIEEDVAQLLNGTLSLHEIERERYYPEQDYDNF